MHYKIYQWIMCGIAACCLTGCPEGFMSEGITDDVCKHNLLGTTWEAPCHDSKITLLFASCDLWTATYDTLQISGFYTADGDTITGGVFAGEQPDSTFCGIGNAKTFEGSIDGESLIIGNHTFVKR